MARGRKRQNSRDLRAEKLTAKEAQIFLGVDERFFYRLIEWGYIPKSENGMYTLGAVLQGCIRGFAEREYKFSDLLIALRDDNSEEEISELRKVELDYRWYQGRD